ncbi:MAG: SulP family inorganic anion transporter [Chthoniobacter sp.]|uniref:SulP family inorganic anion transporter n=1 Tax=Chthoniobacter sp. TaxID=2510640 RepID=UPI0032A59724
MLSFFRPRLLQTLRGYTRVDFFADVIAGVTVGIIALALSMALGIASDRTPAVGIITAIVAGFLNAVFSGSKVQIGGPTAAFIPVVVGVAQNYGADGLLICTLLAGVILILMGISRLGVMIKYIPMPVVAGFTAGIAIYIFSTQVRDFLGLQITEKIPAEFIGKVHVLAQHLNTIHWPSAGIALTSFLLIKLWPHQWARHVPGTIVAIVLGTALVTVLHLPVETIGSRFGVDAIPRSLPMPHWPQFDWSQLDGLVRPAITIALLASIESLLCAVVADGMTEDKHDSNTELCAQGAANIGSALFGGLPATGALARTAANIRSGARTPVAGIVHSLTILGIVLVAAPLARFIPLSVLSAVLVVVALNMGEWRHFARLRHWPTSDVVVFLLTFILTILTDITIAVEVGMVLASVLFIRRISETTRLTSIDERDLDYDPEHSLRGKTIPEGVAAFQLQGAFMFGAADRLESILRRPEERPRVIVLGMKRLLALDATGLHALEDFHHDIARHGGRLIIAAVHTQPFMALSKGGFVKQLGEENFCADMDTALARAATLAA